MGDTSERMTDPPVVSEAVEHGRFPGWWVVAGCFIVLMVSGGLGFYGLAVYLNAFSKEKDWPLSTISLATTLFFVVGGVLGVVVARWIARYDVRYVIVAGGLVGGASLAVLGQVEQQWQLFAVYAVFAFGFAAAGLVPATTVVTRWFHVRRSVALSVASTGLSMGGIVLTPIAKHLLDTRGLAAGTPWLGLIFVAGIVPAAWFLVRPDPEVEGWSPDGARRVVGEDRPPLTGEHFETAIKTRFFICITLGFLLALAAQVGGIQQLVKLVEDRTDARTAQFAVTTIAGTSVVARLVGGQLIGRVAMARFTVVLTATQGIALLMLAFAESTWLIFAAIVLFGTTIGNILMMQPLLIAERFGVRDYPRLFSRSQLVAVTGTAGGPLVLGSLYDVAGSYRIPYIVAACCSVAGAFVLSMGGPATVAADE
ncbi:MAG: MFS transporter [Ilumatobacteraceae bacterium]